MAKIKTKIKDKIKASKTSLKWLIEIIIKKSIILQIALNFLKQKIIYNFDNSYIGDYKYKG